MGLQSRTCNALYRGGPESYKKLLRNAKYLVETLYITGNERSFLRCSFTLFVLFSGEPLLHEPLS